MDKKTFASLMNMEDKNFTSNLYDKIILFQKTAKTVIVNEFLTPNIWKMLEKNQNQLEICVKNFGLFEEAERKMIALSQEEFVQFPIKVVQIKNKSKFSDLEHKDYLGALMSLGIKREKIGDLVINGDVCYFPICDEISDYVLNNLATVGNNPCSVEIIKDNFQIIPSSKFTEISLISTSLRIDCIVSAICNISRNKAIDFISHGKVLLDYLEVKEKDKVVNLGDMITIRNFGKFKIIETIGNTQKGRVKLLIKKYI